MKQTLGLISFALLTAAVACGASSTDLGGSTQSGGAGASNAGKGAAGGSGGAGQGGRGGSAGATTAGMAGEVSIGGESPGGTGGTGVDCSSDTTQLVGATFTVELTESDPTNCCGDVPTPLVFHFDQNSDSGLELVIGSPGQAFRGAVTPKGKRLSVERGLPLRDDGNPFGWPVDNGVSVETLSLCFHPAQDSPALLDGKGTLLVVRNSDDYENQYDVDVSFEAARWDMTAPTLPVSQELDPLDPTLIPVSEPLERGALATLLDPSETPFMPVEQAGTVVGFLPSTILPLGLDARLATAAHDLAGNKLVPNCTLSTAADPGIQALDGFESELRVVNYGRYPATLVSGGGALEGTQSLEVPGGGIALLHLARPSGGAKHVRFDLEPVPRIVQVPASFTVRAGVVGGAEIVKQEFPIYPNGADTLGDAGAAGAAGAGGGEAVTAVDLELSETGDDVLLEIRAPFIEQLVSTDVAAVIDRLRIE